MRSVTLPPPPLLPLPGCRVAASNKRAGVTPPVSAAAPCTATGMGAVTTRCSAATRAYGPGCTNARLYVMSEMRLTALMMRPAALTPRTTSAGTGTPMSRATPHACSQKLRGPRRLPDAAFSRNLKPATCFES